MPRSKRASSLTKGTRYVAEQALNSLYDEWVTSGSNLDTTFGQWAVTRVWDVDYKPTAGRLVIVLDLNEPADWAQCAYISNGEQCRLTDSHGGAHLTEPEPGSPAAK